MQLDLGDLESVVNFAKEFRSKYNRLDVLLCNGGIMNLPTRKTTPQGFEMQFGVNYLGHYTLTRCLMSSLKATEGSRVVHVASNAHRWGKKHMHWEDLQMKEDYHPFEAYAQSKYSTVLFSIQLAE